MIKALRNIAVFVLAATALGARSVAAADDPAFEKASLGWRTALHFDPGAEAPLNSLVQLYQRAGKVLELLDLYTRHLAQFPDDVRASAVLGRLYLTTNDSRLDAFLGEAMARHPKDPLLAWVRAEHLRKQFDPRALEALDHAVALEGNGARRARWLADLLALASQVGKEPVAARRLEALGAAGELTAEQKVQWARRALDLGLAATAGAVLSDQVADSLEADAGIEARFLLARIALAQGRAATAAAQSALLLDKLAPDHWRYREALELRWQTTGGGSERDGFVKQLAERWRGNPESESAALAYGDALATAGRADEALEVWEQSLSRLSESRTLEERCFDLLDQARRPERAIEFIERRLALTPGRQDLRGRQARTFLLMGRAREGLEVMDGLLAKLDEMVAASEGMRSAQWLRARNLFSEAAQVMELVVKRQPLNWPARKELAEIYGILKRRDDIAGLFAGPVPESLPPEVVLEAAQFLFSQKLLTAVRALLKPWVAARPSEFEGRLLLARVHAALGDTASAAMALNEARAQCDTEARYGAWLGGAWQQAGEAGSEADFIREERARLWPKKGEGWDGDRLARLASLAALTFDTKERGETERLLRDALADPAFPSEQAPELRLGLIRVLEGQQGREKDLETELTRALQMPGAAKGDLGVRLAELYQQGQRLDLARAALADLDPAACGDAVLAVRGASIAQSLGLAEQATAFYGRAVQLQPEERGHWVAWTNALAAAKDEAALRLALRELGTRLSGWQLPPDRRELVRAHLAASYWRSCISILAFADENENAIRQLPPLLAELESLELKPERAAWATWLSAYTASRLGDAAKAEALVGRLKTLDLEWIEFPDGLSLSPRQAERVLRGEAKSAPGGEGESDSPPRLPPSLAWAWTAPEGADLQRWDLTVDGQHVVIADTRSTLTVLHRESGRLVWRIRQPLASGGDQPGRGEQIQSPPEWALGRRVVAVVTTAGLESFDVRDGSRLWRAASPVAEVPASVAYSEGRFFLWQPRSGRLDAVEEMSGRLLWSCEALGALHSDPVAAVSPRFVACGLHAAEGRVIVWADGTAVVEAETGRLDWSAVLDTDVPEFPLDLRAEEASASTARARNATSAAIGRSKGGVPAVNRVMAATPFAHAGLGYPGMYAGSGMRQPTVVTWGSNSERLLRGDGVWMLDGAGGGMRYSIFGIPSLADVDGRSGEPLSAIGFIGRRLLSLSERAVWRHDPGRGVQRVWSFEGQGTTAVQHPLPTVALAGRTLLIATQDKLYARDAISGEDIWAGDWPGECRPYQKAARDSLRVWSSLRWSGHGLFFYDGRGRTLTVDWRALAAGGDWIAPVGTGALVCLRGAAIPASDDVDLKVSQPQEAPNGKQR